MVKLRTKVCKDIQPMRHEIENYSWEIVQNMVEREVNAAFKLRVDPVLPSKKEIKRIIRETVKGRKFVKMEKSMVK